MASQEGAISGLPKRDFDRVVSAGIKRPLIMGVDPGLSGCLAVVETTSRTLIDLIPVPIYKTKSRSRRQGFLSHVDVQALSAAVDAYAPKTALCVLEMPNAMRNQGLSSTFRFGQICGQIEGVLAGHYIPVTRVAPAAWKLAMGLDSDKVKSITKVIHWFPRYAKLFELVKHHDRAEAVLLAEYGKQFLRPLLELNGGLPEK